MLEGWVAVSDTRPLTRMQVARLLSAVSHQPMSATERGLVKRDLAELGRARGVCTRTPLGMARFGGRHHPRASLATTDHRAQGRWVCHRDRVSDLSRRHCARAVAHLGILRAALRSPASGARNRGLTREDVLAQSIEDAQLKGNKADFRESAFQLAWGKFMGASRRGQGQSELGAPGAREICCSPTARHLTACCDCTHPTAGCTTPMSPRHCGRERG